MNLVILIGRLTDKVESKTSSTGKSYANFSIAVKKDRAYKNGIDTDFVNISCFNNTANFVSKYCKKGDMISVIGTLSVEAYEVPNKKGKNVIYKVVAENINFITRPNTKVNAMYDDVVQEELIKEGLTEEDIFGEDDMPF